MRNGRPSRPSEYLAALRRRRVVRLGLSVARWARPRAGSGLWRSATRWARPDDLDIAAIPEPTADVRDAEAYRASLLDRLGDGERSPDRPLHVGITPADEAATTGARDANPARKIGDGLTRLGWQVDFVPQAADGWPAVISSLDAIVSLSDDLDVRRTPRGDRNGSRGYRTAPRNGSRANGSTNTTSCLCPRNVPESR